MRERGREREREGGREREEGGRNYIQGLEPSLRWPPQPESVMVAWGPVFTLGLGRAAFGVERDHRGSKLAGRDAGYFSSTLCPFLLWGLLIKTEY